MSDIILRSKLPSPSITRGTLSELIEKNIFRDTVQDKIALHNTSTGITYTYKQLRHIVHNVAANLKRIGVRQGDVLGVCSIACEQCIIFFLATIRIGAVLAGFNAMYTAADLKRDLNRTKSKILFTNDILLPVALEGVKETTVESIITTGSHPNSISFDTLTEPVANLDISLRTPIDPMNDTALILFSSGTTGMPKGVELTHDNVLGFLDYTSNSMNEFSNKDAVVYLPMSHITGIGATLVGLLNGGSNYIMPRFTLEDYCRILAKHKITVLMTVPPVLVLLTKSDLVKRYGLSCVDTIYVGAAPTPLAVKEDLKKQIGDHVDICELYGMTENCGGAIGTPAKRYHHLFKPEHSGSIGLVAAGIECKVVDPDTGKSLGPHKQGEMCFRSRSNMKGYLNNPEATRNTIDKDGFLHTGDMGYYDNNECFYIVDRLKELIKYKAYQVPPSELEDILQSHPSVSDAGVIGLKDEVAGEKPHAWVVLKPGQTVSAEDIRQFVDGKVSAYKRLRGGVRIVDAIPKSPTGKILRRVMRDQSHVTSKL